MNKFLVALVKGILTEQTKSLNAVHDRFSAVIKPVIAIYLADVVGAPVLRIAMWLAGATPGGLAGCRAPPAVVEAVILGLAAAASAINKYLYLFKDTRMTF